MLALRAVRPLDVCARNACSAAAREVHNPDFTSGVEPARCPADRAAYAGGNRSDGCACGRCEGHGHGVEHPVIERRIVRGKVADQGENAIAKPEFVGAVEPGTLGRCSRHTRPLARQLDAPGDTGERALVRDVTDERCKAVRAGGERADRHAPAPVHAGECLVEARLRIKAGRKDVEAARWTDEGSQRHRPIDLRVASNNRDRDVRSQVHRRTASRHQPRTGDCQAALEATT